MNSRKAGRLLALLVVTTTAAPAAGQTTDSMSAADEGLLKARMAAFLRTVERQSPEALVAFFPRAGDLTRVYTLHTGEGTRVSVRRFPPSNLARALKYGGPLWASFDLQPEGQPIGLFYHQLMMREAFSRHGWRRVRGTRFVPAGEPETAGLFVEWRREAGEWVVAAFGDEGFRVSKFPEWCC